MMYVIIIGFVVSMLIVGLAIENSRNARRIRQSAEKLRQMDSTSNLPFVGIGTFKSAEYVVPVEDFVQSIPTVTRDPGNSSMFTSGSDNVSGGGW